MVILFFFCLSVVFVVLFALFYVLFFYIILTGDLFFVRSFFLFFLFPDQTFSILGDDLTSQERATLGHFRYQKNWALLHQDRALMPRNTVTWSSWNYLSVTRHGDKNRTAKKGERELTSDVSVTYW